MANFSNVLKNIFFFLLILQVAPPIIQNLKKQYFEGLTAKTKVGLLPISGVVYDSDYYAHQLKKMFKDRSIKAIMLKIESAGAAAGSAEAIANEIDILKKEFPKPIISLCENICASGSYYIACSTDYIISPPSALIGSIGTKIPYQFKLKHFLEQFKIQHIPIVAGDFKDATDPFTDITPEQKAQLQSVANNSYENFVEHVAKHRANINVANAQTWANGRIFTARQALKIGLIDEIGSQSNALMCLKKLAIIEGEIEWVKPNQSNNFLAMLTGDNNHTEMTYNDMLNTVVTGVCHFLRAVITYIFAHQVSN